MKTILIIIAVLILVTLFYTNNKTAETFAQYCKNCGYKSRRKCSDCVNCGYCVTFSGYGECVPGDERGPYFRRDCAVWEYYNPSLFYNPYYYNYYPHDYLFYNRWYDRRRGGRRRGRRSGRSERRGRRSGRSGRKNKFSNGTNGSRKLKIHNSIL